MIVTYKGKIFSRDEFIAEDLPQNFLADVVALVKPEPDFISVDINSVKTAIDSREIGALLKLGAERELQSVMRSMYLNDVRRGIEGDVVSGAD